MTIKIYKNNRVLITQKLLFHSLNDYSNWQYIGQFKYKELNNIFH